MPVVLGLVLRFTLGLGLDAMTLVSSYIYRFVPILGDLPSSSSLLDPVAVGIPARYEIVEFVFVMDQI